MSVTGGEQDPALESASPEAGIGRREKRRLEAFSDGVFAIAVTLLVLELKVPAASALPPGGLIEALREEWPSYFAYLLSFATILIMWVNHHVLLDYIRHVDHAFLYLNGLLLLTITLVPFPTSLFARYALQPDAHLAAAVYCGLLTLIAVCFNLVWWYAAHSKRLTTPDGGRRGRDQALHVRSALLPRGSRRRLRLGSRGAADLHRAGGLLRTALPASAG